MDIPELVLAKMSTDQKITYQLVTAVQRGELPESLQYLKCGQLSHARWLTTGQRVVFLWTRVHELSGEDRKTLRILVKFFITFYFKLYYDIKVRHLLTDAPRHVLTGVRLLREQPRAVRDVITQHVQSGAWHSHPENLLLSLLSSSDTAEREFGVEKVLEARGSKEYGDNFLRPRLTPPLNFSAEVLTELIHWDKTDVMEPSLTTHLSRAEIEALRDSLPSAATPRALRGVSSSPQRLQGLWLGKWRDTSILYQEYITENHCPSSEQRATS